MLAHANRLSAERRGQLSEAWHGLQHGNVLLTTCHRVELYGTDETLAAAAALAADDDVRVVRGDDAARHLVTVAVGRDSSILGEDQVLHQLRGALQAARRGHDLPPTVDRAFDLALRAGRVARTWLPPNRPTLAEVALDRCGMSGAGFEAHVVGSGEMARRALVALLRRGARVTVGSRTREHARGLAVRHGAVDLEFDPGAARLRSVSVVVVALAGDWVACEASRAALVDSGAQVIDLSSPSALDAPLRDRLGQRLMLIDDLAGTPGSAVSPRTLARLDALVDEAVEAYQRWTTEDEQRAAAAALALRAHEAQLLELDRLWRRMPSLDAAQRAEVTRTVEHLAERLLRDPLEQLSCDHDGSHARAARQLFRL